MCRKGSEILVLGLCGLKGAQDVVCLCFACFEDFWTDEVAVF